LRRQERAKPGRTVSLSFSSSDHLVEKIGGGPIKTLLVV